MAEHDTWFLLVQYRRRGRTSVRTFDDINEAAAAYDEAEQRFESKLEGHDPEMDVLLVGASSLDVVKQRYPSYFTTEKSRSAKVHQLLNSLPAIPAH
ncbi:hypothetical protein [Amycolatopsis taiwanensis]|uniref:AP2/ERF domain-containing protein n=1 Tax=Amycolatopsis taiwanensis TaxID=342230 RepID=A0A9W6VH05_9PSEU|nr:hypothetical protein [Amycolatopsis taiwanensis]GLY68270.1 hypothetical protein Atai01_48890 [Amycolatopsis taiwanensis]